MKNNNRLLLRLVFVSNTLYFLKKKSKNFFPLKRWKHRLQTNQSYFSHLESKKLGCELDVFLARLLKQSLILNQV